MSIPDPDRGCVRRSHMSRPPLSFGQLALRLAFALVCLAVIAFCCGNVGPDVPGWIASLF